jgi:hypothetical protein
MAISGCVGLLAAPVGRADPPPAFHQAPIGREPREPVPRPVVGSVGGAPAIADGMDFWGSGHDRLNSPAVRVSISNDTFYAFALSPDAGKH